MKLSKTQAQVLQDLDHGSILHFMQYMGSFNTNAYWFVSENMRRVRCATVEKLRRLDLVQITKRDPFGSSTTAGITKAGKDLMAIHRAALEVLTRGKRT